MRHALVWLVLVACKYPSLPPLGGGDDGGGDGSLPPGSPMLAAIEPAVAQAGATITLEGTFSDPMTVNFPGGVTAMATVLGPHRATVVVPQTSTSGPLDAMTGNVTTGHVTLRVPSFAPGLANFRTNFEQTDAARMAPLLAAARSGGNAVVIGHDLYVIGGKNGTTPLGSIEHALINADGTLGTFTLVTGVALVAARSGATATVTSGYVYVIGGAGAGGPIGSVERAPIQADGSLGAFSTVSGVALATARTDAASAIVGDSIYVLGGTGASGELASIESAVIDPDGSLEAFTTSAQVLSTPRAGAAALATSGSLYVLGGDASGVTGSIESAAIAPDGTLGAFAAGGALITPRAYFSIAVLGTSVFAIGGTGSGGVDTKLIEHATLTNGTLGSFSTMTGVTTSLARHGVATAFARDHVYLLGGNNGTTELATVEHSSIATHGAVGAFATLGGEPLSGSRIEGGSVTIGDHLYLIGGADLATLTPRMDVDVATVLPDGSLGPFSIVSGVSLTGARLGPAIAVIGNFVFMIGGEDTSMSYTGFTTLERAPINPDGTLGTFQAYAATSLTTGRYFSAAVIVGTNLYLMGGTAAGAQSISSATQASVDASGSISFFFNSPTPLQTPQSNFKSVVLGGYCYVFGGIDVNGTSIKVVERAPIQADNSLGGFAIQTSLSTERALSTTAVVGDDLYLVAGANNVGSPQDPGLRNVDHATIAADGTLGAFSIPAATTFTEGIFFHFGATVGNFIYVLGGGSHTSTTTPTEVKQALLP